ncbi:MAG: hypothetical protein FWH27_14340 [Planctomycetaceae bacterium]|nr:hypothetical protein [Planctomycetaceae bacterium]
MSNKTIDTLLLSLVVGGAVAFSSGCIGLPGPSLGPLSVPIPVPSSLQDEYEDIAFENERYDKVPILGPIPQGTEHVALDTPSDDEVMRALEKARKTKGGVPFLETRYRNNVKIVKEKIGDYIDPPRVVPLIGPVQLHHAHYKCTVYFTDVVHVGWPVPHQIVNEDACEVVYIDHDHYHMVGNVDAGNGNSLMP